jgi:hypothetical protein
MSVADGEMPMKCPYFAAINHMIKNMGHPN